MCVRGMGAHRVAAEARVQHRGDRADRRQLDGSAAHEHDGRVRVGGRDGLDDATYAAAEEAFKSAALEYASIEDVEEESTALSLAGGKLVGIHWMHDRSDEAMRASAGCTASYEFDTELVKHIDLDDKLADHVEYTPHPAEGSPGRW